MGLGRSEEVACLFARDVDGICIGDVANGVGVHSSVVVGGEFIGCAVVQVALYVIRIDGSWGECFFQGIHGGDVLGSQKTHDQIGIAFEASH